MKTYTLFIFGSFEDIEDIEFFCSEVINNIDCVGTLKYVIENHQNIVVIFDSECDEKSLSIELFKTLVSENIRFYLLFPIESIITAHLPEQLKDFIFKPENGIDQNRVEHIRSNSINYDLDTVLEKIEKGGIDSLSPDEKNFLDNFVM